MRLLVVSLIMCASLSAAFAQTPEPQTPPASPPSTPVADPLNTLADYAFILDADLGQELYCKRCDELLIPASMSKLMVYYMVFERIRDGRLALDDEFTVSEHAWKTGGAGTDGSTMFLSINSRVSVENLIRGAVIQSGNDACIVLAEGIAGSETAFAEEMTKRAQEIGLTHSTFGNATGLDHPDQRMTARDIAMLSRLLITEFPELYQIFSEKEFTWNNIRQANRNPLLREIQGADGIKTGHLSSAGYGLAGSAVRDGARRIIVLQGLQTAQDRRNEGARVMRAAFSDFVTVPLVESGAEVAVADVWLGDAPSVPLVVSESASQGMHVDTARSLSAVVHYSGPLKAPVNEGDKVGELVFSADGMADRRIPVLAGASVAKLGLIGRAFAGIRSEE